MQTDQRVKVWDLGVRFFHWLLVASVAVSLGSIYLAPPNWLAVHLWSGAFAAVLVLFRLVWGFTGSTYSRFTSFIPSPRAAVRYVIAQWSGRGAHYLGHNPLGALMIVALLTVLVALPLSGVVTLGGLLKQGPLASLVTFATGRSARQVHEWLGQGLMALVVLHVIGVVVESRRSSENLATAMVTGRKRLGQEGATTDALPVVRGRPWLAAVSVAAMTLLTGWGLDTLSTRPGLGVPVPDPANAGVAAEYQHECGSCHFAFPPSLAAAPTWRSIMASLDDHFGETAVLPPATAARLLSYLESNSAEHWDTLPAHVLLRTDPKAPLRLTATPFWVRRHRDIPPTVFASKAVGGRSQCNACHGDAATGLFAPQFISIPRDAAP